MITLLAGGTGAAKFLRGLVGVYPQEDISVVVNTGDDFIHYGLHVSPDVDTILYCLAGVLSKSRGWGIEGDTFTCNSRLGELGLENWFLVGDLDMATHVMRTWKMSQGERLSDITSEMSARYGIKAHILPMSDERVETRLITENGELGFQDYYVRQRYRPRVFEVKYAGAEKARPGPGVIQAIRGAEAVIVAPSNPVTSIGPILAIKGIREALLRAPGKRLAISPFVGGAALSGPADVLMKASGLEPNPGGLAAVYSRLIDSMVIDEVDRSWMAHLKSEGLEPFPMRTIMEGPEDEKALARETLRVLGMRRGNH